MVEDEQPVSLCRQTTHYNGNGLANFYLAITIQHNLSNHWLHIFIGVGSQEFRQDAPFPVLDLSCHLPPVFHG